MPQSIAPLDILTSGNKHPEREQSDECTTEVRVNAADLAERVSKLLDHLGRTASISSGFRTTSANKAAGGSKKSAHRTGQAVDLEDPGNTLDDTISRDPSLLDTYDLYREDPTSTPGWVHLTTRPPPSGHRTFLP